LQVVDVRDPLRPAHLASLATSGLAYTPKLAGNLLYLAGHRGGFQIIDVSVATAPRLVADIATRQSLEPGSCRQYAVRCGRCGRVAGVRCERCNTSRQIGVFDPGVLRKMWWCAVTRRMSHF